MMNSYVEHVRQPVSRGVEKFLGWLSWVILLGVTALSLFAALVVLNNPNNLNRLESLINQLNINITSNGQILSASEVALNIQNGIWLFIIYLIIVLIFSFIGIVLMRWRLFSATVFLLLAIITIPLFIVLVPFFFFIVSILLFVRKDKILPIQGMGQQQYFQDNQGRMNHQPRQTQPMEPFYQEKNEQNEETSFVSNQQNTNDEKGHEMTTEQEVHSENTNNEEVLSRSKKHQKHQKQTSEFNNKEDEFGKDEMNSQEDLDQREQDPYNYETTHSDEYHVQPGRQKKESKVKKEKPNATLERRNNYEKRMQQQKKYFEEKTNHEQDVENKTNEVEK